jgi:hypothetical protein
MNSAATIISRTELDTSTFLALANHIVGRELNQAMDSARNLPSPEARLVSLLTAITTPAAKPGLHESHSDHCSIGVLAVSLADCTEEVTSCLSGMALLVAPTASRLHTLFIASGTLPQWKGVVRNGLEPLRSPCCREVFDRVRQAFVARGINLWTEMQEHYDKYDCLYLTAN